MSNCFQRLAKPIGVYDVPQFIPTPNAILISPKNLDDPIFLRFQPCYLEFARMAEAATVKVHAGYRPCHA